MATVLAVRSEVTGKRPIKLTPKMQGAGGLGTRLSGGVKKRKAVGGRLITKARKDGASEHVDDNDDVDDVAGNTGIDNASAAAADPSSGAGDAAPLGVQVHADDFSDEEHDEEEERTKLQTEKQVLTVTLISCAAGDGRQDTLNNITERDGASLPSQSPAGSPLEGVAAASDQDANGRLAELERTTQQQSQLISSLLLQLNNGSCSLERGAVGHASGSPSTNGTPRSAPTSQQAHVATPEREMLQRPTSNRASPAVPRKRKYPTMKNNGNVCDVVLHTSLSGIPLRDQILMRQLPSYGKAWNSTCSSRMLICHVSKFPNLPILFRIPMYQKKMELAVVVAFFRQPDDVTSVYPSESVVMRCLIGVWGESKAAALVAVMTYCVARAGASTRKQSDWRARISMNGRRNFADAYGLVCEANPRLKFDYSELICDEERTPTQVYNLESKGGIPLVKPLEKGGLLIWHFAEGTMRPFGTALFDIIVRNAFQKGAGGSATVVKAYHIAYLLYLSPFEFSLGESGGSLQLAVMSGTIKWPHPPLSASSFPSPNLPSFLLLPIFPPPPPLPLLPALFPRPFLPIPSRLFSSPFPNPRYGQSRFEFSLGESGGMVEYSVVHHKARGKRIPTDADVNAADIACYHRKVKAAIRKTLEESPDDQLPAWSEQYQGWVFGPTETVVISGSGFPDLVPDGADPDAAEKKAVALLFEYAQVELEKGKKKKTGSNNSDATMERDLLDDVGYPTWKGQILDGEQLWALIEGLEANGLLFYTHLLTGGFQLLSFHSLPHTLSFPPSLPLSLPPSLPLSLFPSLLPSLSPSFHQKYPQDLARAAELAVASLQAVLARTLQHRSPPLDGTESSPTPPTPKRLELCLVQSRDDIISPPVRVTRTVLVSRRVAMEDAEARRSRLRSMRESAAKQQAASPGAPTPSAALSALPSPDFSPPLIRTHLRVRHPGKADLGEVDLLDGQQEQPPQARGISHRPHTPSLHVTCCALQGPGRYARLQGRKKSGQVGHLNLMGVGAVASLQQSWQWHWAVHGFEASYISRVGIGNPWHCNLPDLIAPLLPFFLPTGCARTNLAAPLSTSGRHRVLSHSPHSQAPGALPRSEP
ncbi:unnamed protein product [Closterium sp. NIES-65]|nr:unnamed protein product [Closterium sp. NIES-65]